MTSVAGLMQVLGEEDVLSGAGFLDGVFLDFLELCVFMFVCMFGEGEKCAEVGASAGERDACSGEVAALMLALMLAVEGVGRATGAVWTTGSSLLSGGGERERGR